MSDNAIAEVIERLEADEKRSTEQINECYQFAHRYPHVPANWEAVAECRGELFGIRRSLSYLREVQS